MHVVLSSDLVFSGESLKKMQRHETQVSWMKIRVGNWTEQIGASISGKETHQVLKDAAKLSTGVSPIKQIQSVK